MIGVTLWLNGVFDLTVSEVLWRLLEPGEVAVDAGANIGYMTSLLAARAGVRGRVYAFEPHPQNMADLSYNVAQWSKRGGTAQVDVEAMGLSDHEGMMRLYVPSDFDQNRGLATLEATAGDATEAVEVPVRCLDQVLAARPSVGVMKIDVEGHELSVLKGAESLLTGGLIRDIVFESHADYPTPVTNYLEALGYEILQLSRSFWGPRVDPVKGVTTLGFLDEARSFLATREVSRARKRLQRRGWAVLGW
jgi:FkbM family methyltransferase